MEHANDNSTSAYINKHSSHQLSACGRSKKSRQLRSHHGHHACTQESKRFSCRERQYHSVAPLTIGHITLEMKLCKSPHPCSPDSDRQTSPRPSVWCATGLISATVQIRVMPFCQQQDANSPASIAVPASTPVPPIYRYQDNAGKTRGSLLLGHPYHILFLEGMLSRTKTHTSTGQYMHRKCVKTSVIPPFIALEKA